jgi:drug/metabolite transporter (DMT)-like permease
MSVKTVCVLVLMVVAGAIGDVLLSKGMKQVGEVTSAHPVALVRVGLRALGNPFVVAGIVGLAIYFFSFSALLSWANVSLVVPISALSFLLTAFLAQIALGEHVSAQRWWGTLLIVVGVMLVARSPHGSAERSALAERRSPVLARVSGAPSENSELKKPQMDADARR